jgi:hypothetical protein
MGASRGVEVADLFRLHGPAYRQSHPLPLDHLRVMHAIEICRTAALGGHRYIYDCGHQDVSYNSCRNRHCPKCQTLRKERWIEARSEDLLPVPYFHIVFTIPAELNPLVLMNRKVMYDLLFRCVSETLLELSANPEHLGARIGFIAILHTWGQNLMEHPHIHCVVPGGGLSPEGDRWVSSRKGFFITVRVMSALFRGKFLDYLKDHYESGDLIFPGGIRHLGHAGAFSVLCGRLYRKQWVVYCKPPFDGPESVLQYLGRYTHRVAISNNRILWIKDVTVSFLWRDYADHSRQKIMTLHVDEFIRRFLLHVLPPRYVRIRHFGLLGNRNCKDAMARCRELLSSGNTVTKQRDISETWLEQLRRICGIDLRICPTCTKGRLHRVERVQPCRCNGPPQHRR